MMTFKHREPSQNEIATLDHISITLDTFWEPKIYNEDANLTSNAIATRIDEEETNIYSGEVQSQPSLGMAFHLAFDKSKGVFVREIVANELLCKMSDTDLLRHTTGGDDYWSPNISFHGKVYCYKGTGMEQVLGTELSKLEVKLHKAVPPNLNLAELGRYFSYQPDDVIRNTLRQTNQMATQIIRFPMNTHFVSRFKMLHKKRLMKW